MLYIKGHFNKTVGPFTQRINFEGTTGDKNVELVSDVANPYYVIQDYKFPVDDIECVIKVNTRAVTLNIAKLKGDDVSSKFQRVKKVDDIKIHYKRCLIRLDKTREAVVKEVAKAKRYKRAIDGDELLREFDEDLNFFKALLEVEYKRKDARGMDKVSERAIIKTSEYVAKAKKAKTYNKIIADMFKV